MVKFPLSGQARKLLFQVDRINLKDPNIKIKWSGVSDWKNYILIERKIVEQILESSAYGKTVNTDEGGKVSMQNIVYRGQKERNIL